MLVNLCEVADMDQSKYVGYETLNNVLRIHDRLEDAIKTIC